MGNKKYTFIVRCGEIALKGMNKPYFERMLLDRLKRALKHYEGISARRSEGLIFVYSLASNDKDALLRDIARVFDRISTSGKLSFHQWKINFPLVETSFSMCGF